VTVSRNCTVNATAAA